jgi:hypothetical protein
MSSDRRPVPRARRVSADAASVGWPAGLPVGGTRINPVVRGMWDSCRIPWLPEPFSAPVLARLEEKRWRHELLAVPYFPGLMAGEFDALFEWFAGAPELRHPVRGRIRGARAFASCCSRRTAASRWSTAHSPTTGTRARWSTTSCGGARRSCRRRPGSPSTSEVRAGGSPRRTSTTTPTRRSAHTCNRPDAASRRPQPALKQASGALIAPGYVFGLAAARLSQPWKGERSPAFQASRSPGALRSQSGRISRVTARRSCHRSTVEGRPQNQ